MGEFVVIVQGFTPPRSCEILQLNCFKLILKAIITYIAKCSYSTRTCLTLVHSLLVQCFQWHMSALMVICNVHTQVDEY